MLRLFVGIELPGSIRLLLAAMQQGCCGARWHAPQQLHLTLNFIGGFDPQELPTLEATLARVSARPFVLGLQGIDYFGTPERLQVLWAGVAHSTALLALQRELEGLLVPLGVAVEERSYTPHVTLARLRQRGPLDAFLTQHARFKSDAFAVEHICLFLSARGERGAEYQVIKRFALPGRAC